MCELLCVCFQENKIKDRFLQTVVNFTGLRGGVVVHYTFGKFMQWMQVC